MPRPRGCTCGTPKPCKIHADVPGADAADTGGAMPEQGGAPALRPGGESESAGAGKKRPDPAPKPRNRKRAKIVAPDAPDDAALVEMLGQLLTMPAIPAALILDCEFCRDHFINEGPKAARELVALSITNPALRGALESLHAGFTKLTIAGVLAGYLAKPMMHHLAPEPVLGMAGPVLGVPPRPEKPKHDHAHTAQTAPAEHDGTSPEAPDDDGAPAEDQYPGAPLAGIYAP